MRKGRNVFWGVLFLLGAVALLVGKLGFLHEFGFWTILCSLGLLAITFEGIVKRSWSMILFSLAFLATVNGKVLGIEELVPWTVLGVAFLGSIGLNMLLPLKHRNRIGDSKIYVKGSNNESYEVLVDDDGGETVSLDISFGSSAKYIKSNCLKRVNLDNSFGSTVVYFDNAVLMNNRAVANVDSSFGSVELYIPADWHVILNVESSFGGVKEYGQDNPNGENVLEINGDVSFGSLQIHHI